MCDDKLDFEKEFDNRYEGLDYDGVEFSMSDSSDEDDSDVGGGGPLMPGRDKEEKTTQEPLTGGYLIRCYDKLLRCLLGRVADSEKERYTVRRLTGLMCVYIGQASSKLMGASRGGMCMSLAKRCRVEGEGCVDECAKALGIPRTYAVLNLDEVSRLRELNAEAELVVGLCRMGLADVSVEYLKQNKDVTRWLRGLRKQSHLPYAAKAAQATLETWKLAVQC